MNFKYKNIVFQSIEKLPFGNKMYHLLQKYITKSIKCNDTELIGYYKSKVKCHLDKFKKYGYRPLNQSNYYEFGAGWNLLSVLGMSLAGLKDCICIDLNELLEKDAIKESVIFLDRYITKVDKVSLEKIILSKSKQDIKWGLKKYFRIEYKAPCDARKVGFINDETIDYIASNVTLEHIPCTDLVSIMKECYRILNYQGIMSVTIDYQDHWSYFDCSISVYNFLQFEEKEWEKFNPAMHYQNRLRHCDYIKIFEEAGFYIKEVKIKEVCLKDKEDLRKIKIATCFKKYTFEELLIRGAHFVLGKG